MLTNDVHVQTIGLATIAVSSKLALTQNIYMCISATNLKVQTDEEPRKSFKLVVDNSLVSLKYFVVASRICWQIQLGVGVCMYFTKHYMLAILVQ